VAELVQQQTGQHVPGDLVAAPLAGDIAAVELDHLRRPGRNAGDAGPQCDAVVPIADTGHDQQPPRASQRARDEIASRGVLAAPRASRHPVVHAPIAVRAGVLEMIVPPGLRPPAPRAEPHRIHHAAAAAPIAAGVEFESLRRLQRLVARARVLNVAPTPRTERRRIRYHPSAIRALRVRLTLRIGPLQPPAAARTVAPEPLQLGMTAGTPQLGGGDFAPAHRAMASSTMR